MSAIRPLSFLFLAALTVAAKAEAISTTVLAYVDLERMAATGLKIETKSDMPDFTITYLIGPETADSLGVYEGGYPSLFNTRGKKLGEVKDTVGGQSVIWTCWSEVVEGQTRYGAETVLPSRRTSISIDGRQDDSVEQFHVFMYRGDLKALAAARKLAGEIIRKAPIQPAQPTRGKAPRG